MVPSPDGDTDFSEIINGALQSDTLLPHLFTICLDYSLRRALDSNRELSFTLHIARNKKFWCKITDSDYTDDLAILSDHLTDAAVVKLPLEKATSEVGLNIN